MNIEQPIATESYWSVDGIEPCYKYGERGRVSWVRLVHYTEDPEKPGGLRYVKVDKTNIANSGDRDNTRDNKIYYGRSYIIEWKLSDRLTGVEGTNFYYVPPDQFGNVFKRRIKIEEKIEEAIRDILGPQEEGGTGEPYKPTPGGGPYLLSNPGKVYGEIFVVNVGQGDAILVKLPNGEMWLIDAYFWGDPQFQKLVSTFSRMSKQKKIDRVIVTHFHYDHIRSLRRVIDAFNPTEVAVPRFIHKTKTTENMLAYAKKKKILRVIDREEHSNIGGLRICLTKPDFFANTAIDDDPNNNSLALIAASSKTLCLLPGDISGRYLVDLTNRYFKGRGKWEWGFYKVTHHCSVTGIYGTFPTSFQPTTAVTSCSANNRYGFPHERTYNVLDHLTMKGHNLITWLDCDDDGFIHYPIR